MKAKDIIKQSNMDKESGIQDVLRRLVMGKTALKALAKRQKKTAAHGVRRARLSRSIDVPTGQTSHDLEFNWASTYGKRGAMPKLHLKETGHYSPHSPHAAEGIDPRIAKSFIKPNRNRPMGSLKETPGQRAKARLRAEEQDWADNDYYKNLATQNRQLKALKRVSSRIKNRSI